MSKEKIPVIRDRKEVRRASRSRKLLFLLFLFFITILIILFFNSTLSKVTAIEIKGQKYVGEADIVAVLNVKLDDQFFLVQEKSIMKDVEKLEQIESVHITKEFPGKIIIEVTEYPAVALEYESDGTAKVLLANGVAVAPNGDVPHNLPILSGWTIEDPVKRSLLKALDKIPTQHLADVSEILPTPTLSYPDKVKIYTRSKYEVVTSVDYMDEMMPMLDNTIIKLRQNGDGPGTITMLEVISYLAFGSDEAETEVE